MIIVFADTGLRIGELSHLTSKGLFWDNDPLYIDIRARDGWKPKDPDIEVSVLIGSMIRRVKSEMAPCKFTSGTRLQVSLKSGGLLPASKGVTGFNLPGAEFGRVWASAIVVSFKAGSWIFGEAGIGSVRMGATAKAIDVVEIIHGLDPDL